MMATQIQTKRLQKGKSIDGAIVWLSQFPGNLLSTVQLEQETGRNQDQLSSKWRFIAKRGLAH